MLTTSGPRPKSDLTLGSCLALGIGVGAGFGISIDFTGMDQIFTMFFNRRR